jgi:NADH:ubiquinone oxidoreductase subunit 4 (subunit M)
LIRFFLYIFLGAILILLGFLAYQYFLSNRVKRVTGKLTSQNLATQQTKGNYDVDWIPKHHLIQSKFFAEKQNIFIQFSI